MKVLKICCGSWENESRDKRELSVCKELGADVIVMAKGKASDYFTKDIVAGYDVLRFSTRPLGSKIPNVINRVFSLFTWAYYASKIDADVISGHDLPALFIGWLSKLLFPSSSKAKLVYDSHEFELGRSANRSAIELAFIKLLEGFLIKRSIFSIMVNDSIANEVQKIYRLTQRPLVVRSTPNYWHLNKDKIAETRKEICNTFGVPNNAFIIMYHGAVSPARNIETLFDAISRNPLVYGLVLGKPTSEDYLTSLKNYANKLGINNRILFYSAVSIEELYRYVGAVDLGTMLYVEHCKNFYFSLPNKFFENIQSLTPIISSNFPEMHRLITEYGIGLTIDINEKSQIDDAIERMRTDKVFYEQCKNSLLCAKQNLCWENEKHVLIKAYKKLFMSK